MPQFCSKGSLEEYVKKFRVKPSIQQNSFYEEPDPETVFGMVPSVESLERAGLSRLTHK